MKSSFKFKKNGQIEMIGELIGKWECENVWETTGKHDLSGNKLVKFLYRAYLITGEDLVAYSRNELKEQLDIQPRWKTLFDLAFNTTKENRESAIYRAEWLAKRAPMHYLTKK